MAVFEYTAKDGKGGTFSGVYIDVENAAMLREELAKMGYVLVKARRKKAQREKKGRVKRKEVVTFAYKFAGMCSAGLSIVRCLEVLEEQSESPVLKGMIADVRQSVETGSNLKDAFEKYKHVFSDFFLGMLEAGETGGKLSKTLQMTADYLEKQASLRTKVKSAFAYPVIVGIMCFLIIGYLVTCVVPVFSKIYKQLHVELPAPTQMLVLISDAVRHWWWAILLLIPLCVVVFRKLSANPAVGAKWDIFKLNMPVFGKLNRMVVVSRLMRTFAMLASAGVSFVEALDVAARVANNHKCNEIAEKMQRTIEAGNPLAGSMKNYDLFPPMIVQLAAAGEEAGVLPEMVNKGVDFLDQDIDRHIAALLVKLEPALTVIMGCLVGFILMGVYLPMFDYMSHLK
jgi:type IV pilus assembly protein PilC